VGLCDEESGVIAMRGEVWACVMRRAAPLL
jgi:hypothetical protein